MALLRRLGRGRSGLWQRWGSAVYSRSMSTGFGSSTTADSSPFDFDFSEAEDKSKFKESYESEFRKKKRKVEFVEGVHWKTGWGKNERTKEIPPHQKGCIIVRSLHVRSSVRKLNPIATLVRKKSYEMARAQLAVSFNKPARLIEHLLLTARQEALDRNWNIDRCMVAEVYVGRGVRVKQIRPYHGKGRFGVGTRYRAHITLVLRQVSDPEYTQRYITFNHRPDPRERRRRRISVRPWVKRGAHLPPREMQNKPWLVRSQMDVAVSG